MSNNMKSIRVHVKILVVLVSFTLALTASIPLRRNPAYLMDNETPRRHYEEFIASRQIRNSYEVSPSREKSSASGAQQNGSLKFHKKPPAQVTVAMYDRLELKCDVSGSPPPAVYWLKNGQPIRESPFQSPFDRENEEEATNSIVEGASPLPKRGLALTNSKLVIDCVDIDAEAIYTCVAESQNERIVSSTYVHIEGEAIYNESVCQLKYETDSMPATIYMWSGTYVDLEGEDAVLLCRATGNPTAKISWYTGDDQPIINGYDFEVLPTGDLKIHNLRWKNHMGMYRCKVENPLGSDEASTFVYPLVSES